MALLPWMVDVCSECKRGNGGYVFVFPKPSIRPISIKCLIRKNPVLRRFENRKNGTDGKRLRWIRLHEHLICYNNNLCAHNFIL